MKIEIQKTEEWEVLPAKEGSRNHAVVRRVGGRGTSCPAYIAATSPGFHERVRELAKKAVDAGTLKPNQFFDNAGDVWALYTENGKRMVRHVDSTCGEYFSSTARHFGISEECDAWFARNEAPLFEHPNCRCVASPPVSEPTPLEIKVGRHHVVRINVTSGGVEVTTGTGHKVFATSLDTALAHLQRRN